MPLSILTDHDYERNRILRVALELVTNADTTPAVGQIAMTNGSAVTLPKWSVIVRDNDSIAGWRVLGAINKIQEVTGFWSFFPATKFDGNNGAIGDPPFGVNVNRAGRVVNLNADLLDGYHAFTPGDGSTTPTNDSIPVLDANSRLSANDPLNSYHVVNLKTLQAASQGISPRNPCQYATAADLGGTLSGNTLTGPLVALSVDGFTPIVTDRVLVKNQTNTVNNGIYTVQVVGVAGTTAWVLLRATDADSSTEVKVGTTTYIEKGTVNIATQWQCSVAGTLNTDPNLWVKSFQASAYVAGNGMDLEGLKFHFGTRALYTVGALWYSNASTTVAQLAPPATLKFLRNPGPNPGGVPVWGDVSWAEIINKPILPTAPDVPGGTVGRYTRWNTGNALVDANLYDTGANVQGVGNTLVAAPVVLGGLNAPFGLLWTNEIRLASTPGAAGGPLTIYGNQLAADDSNGNHRRVVTFTAAQVKSWLALAPSDSNAVPVGTTLTINGTVGQINVATQPTWDLSANRAWTLSLDLATLDNHWLFGPGPTAQDVSSPKRWYSTTGTATEMMIQVGLTQNPTQPKWLVRADGTTMWGDGTIAPAAGIDYSSGLRVFGAQLEFAATAPVKFTSATAPGVAPTFVLGLDATDITRRYTAANLVTLIGQPTLAQNAVGYGDVNSKLTGDATKLRWDYTNERLGVRVANPTATVEMTGDFYLSNIVTTGLKSSPGITAIVTDTSSLASDWTNRQMFGMTIDIRKTGTANFVTSGEVYGARIVAGASNGNLTSIYGLDVLIAAGHASTAPALTTAYGIRTWPVFGGATGSITNLYHIFTRDISAPYPQPQIHYALNVPQLASATGATRTAALSLNLTTTGVGERYNIYAPGTAPNHFAGALGLGVTYALATSPTARVELAIGSTTGLVPIRFAPGTAGTVLPVLTTPIAGALESLGHHLTFTDNATVATRHLLAHTDDVNFTNDPAAAPAGGLVLGPGDAVKSTLTFGGYTEAIGSGPFTMYSRFLVPAVVRGPTEDYILTMGTTSNSYNGGAFMQLVAGQLRCGVGVSESNNLMEMMIPFISTWAGKVVDVVFVRNGTARGQVYINGVLQTTAENYNGTKLPWDFSITSNFAVVGSGFSGRGTVPVIYRSTIFNRALSATEVANLSRYHIDDSDKWGSTKTIYTSDFTTSVDNWSAIGGASNTLLFNQTLDGSAGWLTNQRITTDGRADLTRGFTTPRWNGRVRVVGTAFHATTQPSYLGITSGGYSAGSTSPVALPVGVSTSFLLDPPQKTTSNDSPRIEPLLVSIAGSGALMPVGTVYGIKNVTAYQIGAIVDWDLGVGCGTAIPDRSGRYHGTISGTTYLHLVPKCPTEIPQGPGTITSGLRRYTETITAIDGQTKTVTHNLGSNNVTVTVWDSNNELVNVAVKKRPGVELTTGVDIVFGLINSPVTPLSFQVIIIG